MQVRDIDLKHAELLEKKENMRMTDNIFIHNNVAYKLFGDTSYIEEKHRNVHFLMNNKVPNTPKIIDKIYEGNNFSGYAMEYIKDALSFRQALKKDITFEKKVKAICDIYDAMKYLHKHNIYLGDIHLDNMLITEDGGYLIDLEEIRFPKDEFKFKQFYLIRPNSTKYKINNPTKYTDNAKLMICSLSLLFGRDIEKLVDTQEHEINMETLYHKIIEPIGDSELELYFNQLLTGEFTEYFSDFILRNNKEISINKTH